MNRAKSLLLLLVAGVGAAFADDLRSPHDSFQEYRKGLLSSYSSFRSDVLKDYAKFLESTWAEYQTFKGEKRDTAPKPAAAPVAAAPAAPSAPQRPVPDRTPVPPVAVVPATPPAGDVKSPVMVSPAVPESEEKATPQYTFDFYGLPMQIADIDVKTAGRLGSPADYACEWRALSDDRQSAALVGELRALADRLRLNDYLTFDLVRHYVNHRYGGTAHSSARASLTHYILANMGYDARIAATGDGDGLLLLPFTTKMYGIPYLTIGDRRYHMFADAELSPQARIYTCELPADAAAGQALDPRMNPIDIPVAEKPFDLAFGGLHITGSVNANLFPIIYRYPQMEIGEYAQSVLDPALRQSIVEQVKRQTGSQQTLEAVNNLLQFTQSAFAYATDEQNHGFEKPYFFEETLFYPQCDCEDRVIFYSYLLWHALGVENQLITYPGHESAAVMLPQTGSGDSYDYGGDTFYISDPTYIGAVTGQCMPAYRHNRPDIDYHYK